MPPDTDRHTDTQTDRQTAGPRLTARLGPPLPPAEGRGPLRAAPSPPRPPPARLTQAELADVGVVGPEHDEGDDEDGQPGEGPLAAAQPPRQGHVPRPSSRGGRQRALKPRAPPGGAAEA